MEQKAVVVSGVSGGGGTMSAADHSSAAFKVCLARAMRPPCFRSYRVFLAVSDVVETGVIQSHAKIKALQRQRSWADAHEPVQRGVSRVLADAARGAAPIDRTRAIAIARRARLPRSMLPPPPPR